MSEETATVRCVNVRKFRGKGYPCTHPAEVRYGTDGEPYAYCAAHDTVERRRWAADHDIKRVEVAV